MATFSPFNSFMAKMMAATINAGTAQFVIGLVAEANAPAPADGVIGDLTLISETNISGDLNLTTTSSGVVETNNYMLVVADKQVTASGGDVGPFRYVVVYESGGGNLVCYYDLEDNITILDGNTMNFDFSQVAGLFNVRKKVA